MWKRLQSGGEASQTSPLRQASYSLILGRKPGCEMRQPLGTVITAELRTGRGLLSEVEGEPGRAHPFCTLCVFEKGSLVLCGHQEGYHLPDRGR